MLLEACRTAAAADGFTRLELGSTLPGVALCDALGFTVVAPVDHQLPDGVGFSLVKMSRPI